jgi:hypothetical protein
MLVRQADDNCDLDALKLHELPNHKMRCAELSDNAELVCTRAFPSV